MFDPNRNINHNRLQRVGFMLIASRNQKARRNLVRKNIGPKLLPDLSTTELDLLGFSPEDIGIIKNRYLELAEEELGKARSHGVQLVFKEDPYYPKGLDQIYDPPDFLYVLGNKELLKTEKLAVVGSRRGSKYGGYCLETILPTICKAGLTIVSGMAYGIDSIAHTVALREKGATIGVNPGGLLHLYPAGNSGMINHIIQDGCVISEFALDISPRPFYFPIRNRIIAGISRGILVVEAAMKSGSLITARLGLEQNRDIFAIPGRIDSPVSAGTNFLIQQGAKAVTRAEDILQDFGIVLTPESETKPPDLTQKEKKVLELMTNSDIKHLDYFVERIEESVSAIISVLMGLLLKGIVIEEAGGYRRVIF